jgi:hypothetical protein
LSLHDALGLLLPAMRGVAAAHTQGVIHRDLKPQNIFVCVGPDGRIVTTKVLDFGISTMRDWARGSAMAAMPGLVGTPAYMSPEHLECSDNIDGRADVYGFGLLLYETLSGHMAFPAQPGPELLRRVLFDSPVPLRELRPDLPLGMFSIVDTAMAKHPEQRFASLDQMISAVEAQLMPMSSLPLSGTPSAGIPIGALSYTVSGSTAIAVPAHAAKENSEQHCETRVFGQLVPARREPEEAAPAAEMVEAPGSHQVIAATEAPPPVAPAPDTNSAASAAPLASGPPTQVVRAGVWALLYKVRDFRLLAAAGLAIVALPLVVWMAMRDRPTTKLPTPPSSASAGLPTHSPTPSLAPTTPLVEPLPTSGIDSPPTASLGLGEPSAPEGSVADSEAMALGENTAHGMPAAEKGRVSRAEVAKAKPAAPRSQGQRRARSRAGTLRVDDF